MPTKTDSGSYTIWIEDGEVVYPCRCGETHRGDCAICDYGHHNCDHDDILHQTHGYGICVGCGKTMGIIEDEGYPDA